MFNLSIFADLQILVCSMTKFVMPIEPEFMHGCRPEEIHTDSYRRLSGFLKEYFISTGIGGW
jgi:hypothetical protein